MKREIKFRAWDTLAGIMKDADYVHRNFNMEDLTDGKFIAMQFTGINDRDGKPIYEGDILRMFGTDIAICVNVYGSFYHKHIKEEAYGSMHNIHYPYKELKDDPYYEVIGNIYQNPDLL